jgi:methyl-accepting chemotaxis protein
VLLAATLVVAGVPLAALFATRAVSRARDELDLRGSALLRTLARHEELHAAVARGDREAVAPVLAEVLAAGGDVQYVAALDPTGAVIAAAARRGGAAALVEAQLPAHRLGAGEAVSEGNVRRFTQAVIADGAGARTAGHLVLALSADRVARDAWLHTSAAIALTGLAQLAVFVAIFGGIARRTRRMMDWTERFAAGDLATELAEPGDDEVGRVAAALRRARDNTRAIVGELREVSDALAAAATEVRGAATAQLGEAGRQAASVADTGATVAELRQIFHASQAQAEKVIELARDSEASSSAGEQAVSESAASIGALRARVDAVGETLGALVERTQRIHELVAAVHDLAEQSNVVALNAAIQASHAGEVGRGFAVVAAEVRDLSSRSRDAAKRVARLVDEIAGAAGEATGAAGEGRRHAASSVELSRRAGDAIAVLARTIGDSSAAARQIAVGTREQGAGVDRIWQAMQEIDRSAGEATTRIAALERASQEIAQHSEKVQAIARLYRLEAGRR